MAGPLAGLTAIELSGAAAVPFGGMLLADMGARVIRVDPPNTTSRTAEVAGKDILRRGRESIALDLKHADGVRVALDLVAECDVALEGWRPGVAERLGLGPDRCLARNPRLVYGRLTGWGQSGPYAAAAGHDINYIAVAGALGALAQPGVQPTPPLNLLGDFAGGGMLMAFGVVCAVLEAKSSGAGQVIDAAMVDGSALLLAMSLSMRAADRTDEEASMRGAKWYYNTYRTSDGKYISVGAHERKFRDELIAVLSDHIDGGFAESAHGGNQSKLIEVVAGIVGRSTQAQWVAHFAGRDACFAPVLDVRDAPADSHLAARKTYTATDDGRIQPAAAPRFSRTTAMASTRSPLPGQDTDRILTSVGYTTDQVRVLRDSGAIA